MRGGSLGRWDKGLGAPVGCKGDLTSKALFSWSAVQLQAMLLVNDGDSLASLTTWSNHRLANRQQFCKGDCLLRETEFTVRLPLKALEMFLTHLLARGSP